MTEVPQMELTTKVLLIRFSSMGDVILTSPVIRALHAMLEGKVDVHYLTKSAFSDAVSGLGGVEKVWTIDHTTAEVEEGLKKERFHYVVDLHNNARSAFVKRALRAGEGRTFDLTFDKRSFDKILLVRTGWDRLKGQHVVERYLQTLTPFGSPLKALEGEGDGMGLTVPLVRSARMPLSSIVFALGAAHAGKAIPEEHWAAILSGLDGEGQVIQLIGGPSEYDMAGRLVDGAGDHVVNSCGLSWRETFQVLSNAALLIVGDTGAMHAGAAMQTPMVVVWGCTSPSLGMGPWKPHSSTIELEPINPERGRPCSRLGNRCRHSTPCMHRVSPQRILDAARVVLSQTRP